ncbi:MAG TPA: hypothetical protein VFY60_14015 [Pyrinomonadaceae bacterium]|nr:hypothetical protein [Pyrinomonadaceae bacterium]
MEVTASKAEENEGGHGQRKEEKTRQKTTPDPPVDHIFGLKIQGTRGAAAGGLLQHISAISTGLCAHSLLLKRVMHYSTGPARLVRLDSLDKVFGRRKVKD